VIWLFVGTIVPSAVICWLAAWAIRRLGERWGLIDEPGKRKVHQVPMPTGGGLAIWLGIVAPFAIGQLVLWAIWQTQSGDGQFVVPLPQFVQTHLAGLVQESGRLWMLLGGGTVLTLLGAIDDKWGLDWKLRMFVQAVVATVMVWLGWRASLFIDMPILTDTLSVIWIVGLINTFNMLDNMDGLSAGVATIVGLLLATVMFLAPDPITNQPQFFCGGFLLVMVGSLVGFLLHNRPPARLFMGDAGSYLIGYLLAMATLTATFAGEGIPQYAVLAPLCVMAVPLYDTVTVVLIRLRAKKSPFEADTSHFSHRLVELGMTNSQAVLTIYLATATCGLGALLLHQVNAVGAGIILLMIACILTLVGILETVRRRSKLGRRKRHRR